MVDFRICSSRKSTDFLQNEKYTLESNLRSTQTIIEMRDNQISQQKETFLQIFLCIMCKNIWQSNRKIYQVNKICSSLGIRSFKRNSKEIPPRIYTILLENPPFHSSLFHLTFITTNQTEIPLTDMGQGEEQDDKGSLTVLDFLKGFILQM